MIKTHNAAAIAKARQAVEEQREWINTHKYEGPEHDVIRWGDIYNADVARLFKLTRELRAEEAKGQVGSGKIDHEQRGR